MVWSTLGLVLTTGVRYAAAKLRTGALFSSTPGVKALEPPVSKVSGEDFTKVKGANCVNEGSACGEAAITMLLLAPAVYWMFYSAVFPLRSVMRNWKYLPSDDRITLVGCAVKPYTRPNCVST